MTALAVGLWMEVCDLLSELPQTGAGAALSSFALNNGVSLCELVSMLAMSFPCIDCRNRHASGLVFRKRNDL